MKYRVFHYALPAPEDLPELNAFLSSHRITTVERHLLQNSGAAALVFVVEYSAGSGSVDGAARAPRIDYRERLSDDDFAVYTSLRDQRKRISDADGVAVYNIFTNAQLAEIAQRGVRTVAALEGIEGIGKTRVEKYGERLLSVVAEESTGGGEAKERGA